MRYLLVVLTLAAAVAFVLSVAVEAGWIGATTPAPAPRLTAGPASSATNAAQTATPTLTEQRTPITAYYFAAPNDVSVSPQGQVFVADTYNRRVVQLGPDGTQFQSWGKHAIHPASMSRPERVTAYGGGFYVIDSTNTRVEKFSSQGGRLASWTTGGSLGQMTGPTALSVDAHGTVYLADGNNDQILRLTPDGHVAASFSTKGFLPSAQAGPNDPGFPQGLALDRLGKIYVAYPNSGVVQKFSPAGVPIDEWRLPQRGATANDAAVDPAGNVYVLDSSLGLVSRFTATGPYLGSWGGNGHRRGQMNHPAGISVDAHGHVYVADTGNSRVEEFTTSGRLVHVWSYG
ncbi:MAG TPA: NHL repeat-containing protein [Chloroflexota bacterium]